MTAVSIKEARKRLSELVDSVEKGESITITRRGRIVAELRPAKATRRKGLPDLSAFRAQISVKGEPLSQTVIELRAAERY